MGAPLKIVWLCTFSNDEKRSHLPLWRRSVNEIGQWIPNLAAGFVGDKRFEIHVVSSEAWMKKARASWVRDGIVYHCYQPEVPGLGYSCRVPFGAMTRFCFNRRHIRKILGTIQPDLVHLFGAENPEYASAVLDLDASTPVLVTIQGFVFRQARFRNDFTMRSRCAIEAKVIRKCRHFMGDYDSAQVVREMNPDLSWSHFYFPVNEQLIAATPSPTETDYDLLFAGGLTKAKGFPDYLELVRILRLDFPNVRAGVVGRPETCTDAQSFLDRHGLHANIVWLGRFPDQSGVFLAYRRAKLFIAPTYNDAFASTIRECMLLGTPVVAYRTGGIPFANRDGNENVAIVEQGDVRALAVCVSELLRDGARREDMARRARLFASTEFSLKANVDAMKREYAHLTCLHHAGGEA